MTKTQKLAAAKLAKAGLAESMGKGTVMTLNEATNMDVQAISTGSLGLNIALGIGGLPRGRVVEIYGSESSGKTTIATHVMAEAQKHGGLCAIIDSEHGFDRNYAEALGINLSELDFSQPDDGDQGLEIADKLIQSGAYDVVVVDSVAALTPRAEMEAEMGSSKMGLHARLMSQALRKLTANVHKTNTLLIFINQLREKLGVMFGNPNVTTGGNALKFYASVRLEVSRSTTNDNTVFADDKEKLGNLTKVTVVKNKVAPPFKKAEFDILYGKGIDRIGELIKLGTPLEILKKHGKTITYGADKYDIQDFTKLILDNDKFYDELATKIINASKL